MKTFKSENSNCYDISIIDGNNKLDSPYKYSVTSLGYKNWPESDFCIITNNIYNNDNEKPDKLSNCNINTSENEGSDFEKAIKATEYGKFNWFLLFVSFWGYMACMNSTTTISLILPSAECDLQLTNFHKGMLNAIIYLGMIVSAFFWGLVSDAIGRRNVLITAFALDFCFSLLTGLAQSFPFLLTAKLCSGLISSAPIPLFTSFLAENHGTTYRASVIVWTGIFVSIANVVLPLLAWLIIPNPIHIVLFNGYISLPSWRIFLLISVIPTLLALTGLLFFDESPKFLMFQGKNEEALKVFQKIYSLNTGKPANSYPIKCLKNERGSNQNEVTGEKMSVKRILNTGWKQMVPIFSRPYVFMAILPCTIQFFCMQGLNMIRLWSPQLFSSAIESEKLSGNFSSPSSICDLIIPSSNHSVQTDTSKCSEILIDEQVYFNSMISGAVTGVGYFISGYIVKIIDRKWLIAIGYTISIGCSVALYWSTSSKNMVVVISIYIATLSMSVTALMSVVTDIFPTSLRTTAQSFSLTFGRLGIMVGNLLFPLLLDWHCSSPFILIGFILFLATILTLQLPKTKGKDLE